MNFVIDAACPDIPLDLLEYLEERFGPYVPQPGEVGTALFAHRVGQMAVVESLRMAFEYQKAEAVKGQRTVSSGATVGDEEMTFVQQATEALGDKMAARPRLRPGRRR